MGDLIYFYNNNNNNNNNIGCNSISVARYL